MNEFGSIFLIFCESKFSLSKFSKRLKILIGIEFKLEFSNFTVFISVFGEMLDKTWFSLNVTDWNVQVFPLTSQFCASISFHWTTKKTPANIKIFISKHEISVKLYNWYWLKLQCCVGLYSAKNSYRLLWTLEFQNFWELRVLSGFCEESRTESETCFLYFNESQVRYNVFDTFRHDRDKTTLKYWIIP